MWIKRDFTKYYSAKYKIIKQLKKYLNRILTYRKYRC